MDRGNPAEGEEAAAASSRYFTFVTERWVQDHEDEGLPRPPHNHVMAHVDWDEQVEVEAELSKIAHTPYACIKLMRWGSPQDLTPHLGRIPDPSRVLELYIDQQMKPLDPPKVIKCIQHFTHLRVLTFAHNGLFPDGTVEALTGGFPDTPHLLKFSMEGSPIGDEGMGCLVRVFPRMPFLTNLGLGGFGMGVRGARTLAENLSRLPLLETLAIHHTPWRNEGLEAFVGSLVPHPKLTTLRLVCCEIGREGLEPFLGRCGEKLPNLRLLILAGDLFPRDQELFAALQAQYPEIRLDFQ